MRDILLVASFEVRRAIRTWRAVALLVLYAVASGGGAWMFTRFVWLLENTLAEQLHVAKTRVPGAMLAQLVKTDTWREVLTGMTGSPELVDALSPVPPLALFALWFGFLVVPFFAASASAECLAIDVNSRAIRYEAQRTGRLELVLGRFVGQLALTTVAAVGALVVVWIVGMTAMVGNAPLGLAGWLGWYLPRTLAFGVPFVAIGVAASALTASPAWARLLAVGATAGSWVAFGLARWAEDEGKYVVLADVALQVLPQGWLRGLWHPGAGWLASAIACVALGGVLVALGYVPFSRRDL
ncbi:MAG: ABC transporter permease subunit [Myxococcota bacterium]